MKFIKRSKGRDQYFVAEGTRDSYKILKVFYSVSKAEEWIDKITFIKE